MGKSPHILTIQTCLFGLMMAFIAQSSAGAEGMKSVYDLPANIYDVKGMGNWSMGSKSGQVRLVITRHKKRDEVYLQWVQWDDGQPISVESSISVTEINKDERYLVTFIRREVSDGQRKIVLGLEGKRTKELLRAEIKVREMGLYQCQIKR